jgi:hypothetical protein
LAFTSCSSALSSSLLSSSLSSSSFAELFFVSPDSEAFFLSSFGSDAAFLSFVDSFFLGFSSLSLDVPSSFAFLELSLSLSALLSSEGATFFDSFSLSDFLSSLSDDASFFLSFLIVDFLPLLSLEAFLVSSFVEAFFSFSSLESLLFLTSLFSFLSSPSTSLIFLPLSLRTFSMTSFSIFVALVLMPDLTS